VIDRNAQFISGGLNHRFVVVEECLPFDLFVAFVFSFCVAQLRSLIASRDDF
jgi:hypothetical protein